MKAWKKAVTAGISGAMVLTMALPAYAGQWQFDSPEQWQWKYIEDDGTYPVNAWKELDGKWYHMDENGYLDIGWHSYQETDTYLYSDLPTTNEVKRWYFFDNNGVMATQGEWEGGRILENGHFQSDWASYSGGSYIEYYPNQVIRNEEGFIVKTISGTPYQGTLAWKVDFAQQWYNMVWANNPTEGEWRMDYQLPENWSAECPNPLLRDMVEWAWNYAEGDYYYWFDWYVDENSVFHVAAICETNESYWENPDLIPRKSYNRATGVWSEQ